MKFCTLFSLFFALQTALFGLTSCAFAGAKRFQCSSRRMKKMENKEFIRQLEVLAVEKRPTACFGCGMEHDCSVHGCAVIKKAISLLKEEKKTNV